MPKTTKLPMTKKINVVYNNEGTKRVQTVWRIREKGDEKMCALSVMLIVHLILKHQLCIQSHHNLTDARLLAFLLITFSE